MENKAMVLLLLTLAVSSCEKESSDPTNATETNVSGDFGDSISEEDNAFIESLSTPNPTLREMFGYDGTPLGRPTGTTGASGVIGDLIDKMLKDAQALSGQKTHLYPQVGNDPTKPAHMGLVYSYGQRDITQRLPPPSQDANPLHRTYSVYGTDCSGFIINLLNYSNVNINTGTTVKTFEQNLFNAIKNNNLFRNVIVANLGNLPISSIKSGDFILWIRTNNNNHMGIMCKVATGKTVFQSNGTGTPESEADQTKNLGSRRGVHPIALTAAISTNPDPKRRYWGTGYQILRLRDTIDYNLTNDSVKYWKVNPQGTTTYCGQSAVNPLVAMDDIYIFNSNGTFSHRGGSITIDPNLPNCGDGGNYNNTWAFNNNKTSIILGGGIELRITSIRKSRITITTPDSRLDLIPY
ncbi:hypothetical protein [Hymenobacter jeollabukensis]|uniref:NlpC/P60 family protein n=1 Tax=Hymenobacter jeollabukensis TaxID=2025313 RepID=A0A5R8WKM1_9BACT|nr:hypothetical protein [Hymenobacter jeollabukensis]TLM89103.1 hypothetical protein FDY95_21270 [Hymenobacter jeollabukensis]